MPSTLQAAAQDIRSMRIRGAAAIAVAAADALARHVAAAPAAQRRAAAAEGARALLATRPTAVSLAHAVARVQAAIDREGDDARLGTVAEQAARSFAAEVERSTAAIVEHGVARLAGHERVLTHCHSSTVVAVLAAAKRLAPALRVFATETRPFGQGLVTVRQLAEAGVPATLVVDSAARHVLATQGVTAVLVGADTVARDGSLFNKVGTSGVAALAEREGVPFLSAAGFYKFTDRAPGDVPVEERAAEEVAPPASLPPGVQVLNPAFDRTEPALVAAYLTEDGPLRPEAAVRHALRRLAA